MEKLSLNKLYSQYEKKELSRADLENSIYKFFINSQNRTCLGHWDKEEYEDYISWFYPRLKKAIDSYSDTGSSFEAFMEKFTRLSSKEYRARITNNSITEYSAWSAIVPELYVREETPEYITEKKKEKILRCIGKKEGRKSTRRVLALILKCYYYVSDDFIERTAPMIGMKKNELKEMVDKIRSRRQKKDDDIYLMKERIYSQFYRCIVYEKKLSFMNENTPAHDRQKIKLEKARGKLERMRKRFLKIRTDPTNREIAEVIGIKKGTVDASLHKLKIKLEDLAKKSELN